MKTGIASVVIGTIGLILITYFYYQTEISYDAVGEAQHVRSIFAMSFLMQLSLFALEVLGVVLGYFSFRSRYKKLGLLGMVLGTFCLILLYGYAF